MRVSDGSRWLRVSGFEVFQGVGLSFLLGPFSTGWLVSRREGLWDLQLTGIRASPREGFRDQRTASGSYWKNVGLRLRRCTNETAS